MADILQRHRTELIAGVITTIIVVTLLLFPDTAQGVEIEIDPLPDIVRKGQAISLNATVNVPPNQFISALNLSIDSPDGESSIVPLPLEEGAFDLTGEPGVSGELSGELTVETPAVFGYGYGYGNFNDNGSGYGYGYGYGFGGFSSGGAIIIDITYTPPSNGIYTLSLSSISNFDGEQAIAQDQIVVTVIDPRINVEITASATEITSGEVVTLFISEMNDGDVSLSNPFVELTPLGLVLDENSPSFTGGDTDANGELNVNETWAWQTSLSVSSSITIDAIGHAADPLGDDVTDENQVSITVVDDNLAPELAAISDRSLSEGDNLQINVIATDPNGNSTITLTISGQPDFVTFADNGNGIGMLTIQPGFDDADTYENIQIIATDVGGLTDVETFSLTVVNKNSPPDLAPIDDKVVSEGDTLQIVVSAVDPEGDEITLSETGLPVFASLDDFGGGDGVILVNPGFDDAGDYDGIEIEAADDSGLTDTETFSILVLNQNRAPELAAIENISVDENETVEVEVTANDPDNDDVELRASGLPDFVAFTDNGGGTGTLSIKPDFDDASLYVGSRITATDGDLSDTRSFILTVNNVNRAPEINHVQNQEVDEGEILELVVTASDPDGDQVELDVSEMPEFANFSSDGNGNGVLRFEPGFDDEGDYEVEIVAQDEEGLTDTESFTVKVENVNRGPNLNSIRDREVTEGDVLIVRVEATDPDDDDIRLSISGEPNFVKLDDNEDGTGTLTIEPDLKDSGEYDEIEIIARDENGLSDTESFLLTVINLNRPPTVEALGRAQVEEGKSSRINVRAKDIDGDEITLTVTGLPVFANFIPERDGKGTILIEPGFNDEGVYNGIEIVATDEFGLTGVTSFTFIVANRNGPPTIAPIGKLEIKEGEALIERVVAVDPDGDEFKLEVTERGELPGFALFVDNGNGTGTLLVEPGFDDEGLYEGLEIRAKDRRDNQSIEVFTIRVINVNRAPELSPISDKTVGEDDILHVNLNAIDPDGDSFTLTISGEPDFVTLEENEDGTWTIVIAPDGDDDEGVFEDIEVTASDLHGLADTETFSIAVEGD